MRINFAQFPIYDGIKKEKLIEEVDIIRRSTPMLSGLLADSLNDYLDKKKEEQHED